MDSHTVFTVLHSRLIVSFSSVEEEKSNGTQGWLWAADRNQGELLP